MQKRSIGVTLYSALYLLFAALMVRGAVGHLIALGYSILHICDPGDPHCASGVGLVMLVLAGFPFTVLPPLILATIGIGLIRLSNKTRIFMFIVNPLFIYVIANFLYATTKPWKALNPSLVFMAGYISALLVFSSSFYFFTRPKVKEQFK